MKDIRIIAPAGPGAAVINSDGTPHLEFGSHPQHGEGWTLWYLDDNGDPNDHFISGGITDGGWALAQARQWLGREAGEPAEPRTAKAYAATHAVLCAHADQDGQGAHWLQPGERCEAQ